MNQKINLERLPKVRLYHGDEIPGIGMGTFGSDRFKAAEVAEVVADGIRCGYRMFDCASCYGNEAQIGQAFEEAFLSQAVRREDLYIMTKVWNDMHDRVEESARKSIADLKCDYIDLFFIHWPFRNYHAPGCDINARNPESHPFRAEEYIDTYRQCEELVKKGLVKQIGMSNMTIAKLEAVLPSLEIAPAACEIELHPCFQQQKLFEYLVSHHIQPIGYMPIGSPARPERDKMKTDIADLELPEMQRIADKHGVHPALIALKWASQRGQIPIPFSTTKANYINNLKCLTEDPLSSEEMEIIAGLERNNRLVKGHVFLWEGAEDWHALWDEE